MHRFGLPIVQPRRQIGSQQKFADHTQPHARRLKIAILSDRVYPYFKGGAEKRYWEIAKGLRATGHEVHFYTGQWPEMPRQIVVDGITLHGVYRVGSFYVNGHKSIKESVIYSAKLLPCLLVDDYDLIECEQFPLLSIFSAKVASLLRRKPLVVTWHEVWGQGLWMDYLGQLGRIGALIERVVVHLPDRIIAVSTHTSDKLHRLFHIPQSKLTTVPNGFDPNWNRRLGPGTTQPTEADGSSTPQSNLDWPAGRDRRSAIESSDLISVGRLISHKNVDMVLQVVAALRQSISAVRCIIVGDGPERAKLQERAAQLGVEKNVQFLGYVENARRVYSLISSSRVFLLPSVREGFGIVVVEANACGVPVVVVDHEDNAACQLIQQGHNGFVCRLDPADIAKAVMQILEAPRQQFAPGCQDASRPFIWPRIATAVERLYCSLFTDRRPTLASIAETK
jgi:glycosyltransferase involved in cell wall biosynthesis